MFHPLALVASHVHECASIGIHSFTANQEKTGAAWKKPELDINSFLKGPIAQTSEQRLTHENRGVMLPATSSLVHHLLEKLKRGYKAKLDTEYERLAYENRHYFFLLSFLREWIFPPS